MISLFNTPYNSHLLIGLVIAYGIVGSICTADISLMRAEEQDILPDDEPMLPNWIGIFHLLKYGLFITILLLNWKFALTAWLIKSLLEVLPVLETIGNIITAPLKRRNGSTDLSKLPFISTYLLDRK